MNNIKYTTLNGLLNGLFKEIYNRNYKQFGTKKMLANCFESATCFILRYLFNFWTVNNSLITS